MCKSDWVKMHLTEMFQKWDLMSCSGWSVREKPVPVKIEVQISAGALLQL